MCHFLKVDRVPIALGLRFYKRGSPEQAEKTGSTIIPTLKRPTQKFLRHVCDLVGVVAFVSKLVPEGIISSVVVVRF